MPRQAEPFNLIKCSHSQYWYFTLPGWTSYKSTGQLTKTGAMKVVQEAMNSKTTTIES